MYMKKHMREKTNRISASQHNSPSKIWQCRDAKEFTPSGTHV